ncbi:hypothetical protein OE88DRAFT_1735272 [Heliocybe sulcata]|uniref:Transmembrane protein n=1 Tax=Heliocybe sulcata TaxID=5364 RepID=A0A5C3N1P0_9AGAM|nr:hypothetical protein OE88DRAFT_1735272 [Heliocybe sulcata]
MARRRLLPLLALGSTVLLSASAQPRTGPADISGVYNISANAGARIVQQSGNVIRQVDPQAQTSSSYDYWWPYPAGGVTTTPTTTIAPFTDPALATTTALDPAITIALPSLSSSISSNQSAALVSSSTSLASSSSSASASSNITTITALPPSSTPTSHARQGLQINPLYLVPVFAFVGICMGALCAWCCCGRRKKGPREEECVPGPRYVPAQGDESQAQEAEKVAWSEMSREQTRSSEPRTPFSWPTPRDYEYHRGLTFDHEEAEDMQRHEHTEKSIREEPPQLPAIQPTTPYSLSLLSPYADGTPDESTRQKSVRRSLLSRIISIRRTPSGKSVRRTTIKEVKTGRGRVPNTPELEEGWSLVRSPLSPDYGCSEAETEVDSPLKRARTEMVKTRARKNSKSGRSLSMRQAHRRVDSDFSVDMVRTPTKMTRASRATTMEATSSQERDPTVWRPGGGFRIVQEDPEDWEDVPLRAARVSPETNGEEKGSWIRNIALDISKSLALSAAPTRMTSVFSQEEEEDKYSPIPVRTKRESRSPRSGSPPALSRRTTPQRTPTRSGKKRVARLDSVLPPTPALLMSPPLESQLFFSSPSSRNVDTPRRATTRKLQINKTGSSLPFPSGSTEDGSPYRGRLTQAPTRPAKALSLSPTGHSRPTSPKERYKARHGALTKVDEILSRSWSDREMLGGVPQSPTMFGAIHSAAEGEEGGGIEQRLFG